MNMSSHGTPPSAPAQRAAEMTEHLPGPQPDQVPVPHSSGGQPPKGRRSGTQTWIVVLVALGGLATGLAHGGSQRTAYLLGLSVGAVLSSITLIVLAVRASRSQRAVQPSYDMPGYVPPGPPPAKNRIQLIVASALGAIGLIGIILCTALLMHTSTSQANFNDPSVVAASIKTQVQQRLSDQSSQYFELGVTVTSVVCTPAGTSTDHCAIALSDGVTTATTAVIMDNGAGYRTR